MRFRTRYAKTKLLLASAAAVGLTLVAAHPAAASYNDDFDAYTTDGCGLVQFVDYGPGAPGGGNNDDYIALTDNCADHHGVEALAWTGDLGTYVGYTYNGDGAGATTIWDPWKYSGNIVGGEKIEIEVCLVDGPRDVTGARCGSATHTSVDG